MTNDQNEQTAGGYGQTSGVGGAPNRAKMRVYFSIALSIAS